MITKQKAWLASALLLSGIVAGPARGQQQYVYPKLGQTPEQQKKDEFDCYTWAAQQTGYDPVAITQTAQQQTVPSGTAGPAPGSGVRGAAVGAAGGAAIGAIAGDAGKGAAIGAIAGGAGGRLRSRATAQAAQQQQVAQAKAAANEQAKRTQEYQKARAACLEAKGYTVK